jgi:hypothetical protein
MTTRHGYALGLAWRLMAAGTLAAMVGAAWSFWSVGDEL